MNRGVLFSVFVFLFGCGSSASPGAGAYIQAVNNVLIENGVCKSAADCEKKKAIQVGTNVSLAILGASTLNGTGTDTLITVKAGSKTGDVIPVIEQRLGDIRDNEQSNNRPPKCIFVDYGTSQRSHFCVAFR